MKFKDLVQENGHITSNGKKFVKENVIDNIGTILDNISGGLSINELQTLNAVFLKEIADFISNRIQEKTNLFNKFNKMSDEDFELYLDDKYGVSRLFTSLTNEEYDRYGIIAERQISELKEERKKNKFNYMPCNGVRFD